MGCSIAETYDNGHPRIYFRDGLVVHKDGGLFEPHVHMEKDRARISYECTKCRYKTGNPMYREPMTNISLGIQNKVKHMYKTDIISRPTEFRFEAFFNLKTSVKETPQQIEKHLSEFIAGLKFAEDNGVYIGKRHTKDLGKISFKNLSFTKITLEDVKKRAAHLERKVQKNRGKFTVWLKSDTISEFPLQGKDIARAAKNASKFFNPEYRPYDDPTIKLMNTPREFTISISLLDFKLSRGSPRFFHHKNVIPRGSKFTYHISNASQEFYIALTLSEMMRGVGDRTSFGKGEFSIM